MACSSCNRNNRRSNNWGCRKALQNTRWPSCGSMNGCGSCGGNTCANNCGSCANGCGSCSNNCGSCASNCNTCTSCGSTTVCSGRNTAWAQPYDGTRAAWNSRMWNGRDWTGAGRWFRDRSGWSNGRWGCREDSCFPFYCGPCGPVESSCGCTNNCSCTNGCECADDCSCNCGCSGSCLCREPVYGFFTQVGTVDVNSGGVIPFNGGSTVEGIWKDGGELTLDTAGVYMVTLSADVPENVTLYTELDVRVNGVTNPGGRLILDKDYTGAPLMSNTQTVITVNEGAVVTVTSSEGVAFSTSEASLPIVTLSIVKLS